MPQIVKKVPPNFAFKGEDIPLAMPIGVSPVQQATAAAVKVVEEAAATPADELDKLFPQAMAVTVQVYKGRDAQGRKMREPQVVHLEEATIKEWAEIAKPMRELAHAADVGVDVATMIERHRPQVVAAISAATDLPVEAIDDLKAGDIATLIEAVVKVNSGFFLLRLPQLFNMATQLGGRALGGGQTSSPTSTESESPTLPH